MSYHELVEPESSNVKRYGYRSDGTFTIEFKNGTKGTHEGVPRETFLEMGRAESAGKFYHANIKGKFPWSKIEAEQPEAVEV